MRLFFIHMITFRLLLMAAAICIFTIPVTAQADLPDKPLIQRVTVDTSYHGPGHRVLIEWLPSKSTDVESYIIRKESPRSDYIDVGTVSADVFSFMHELAELENLEYTVVARDSSGNESLNLPYVHQAVLVNVEFDTCYLRNIVRWNPYIGWDDNISYYAVRVLKGCEDEAVFVVDISKTEFIHEKITENSCYNYMIETVRNYDNLKSHSNIAHVETSIPDPPGFLIIDYVNVVGNSNIELSFTTDISSSIRDFQILRSLTPGGDFLRKQTIRDVSQSTNLVVDQVATSGSPYYYRIDAVYQPEGCPNSRVLMSSNIGSSILLKGTEQDKSITLNWTPYIEYPDGVMQYIISRTNSSGNFVDIGSVSSEITTFSENISTLIDVAQLGELKYQVRAIPASNPFGQAESHSNILTIPLSSTLHMPNAFTPNGDGQNDRFGPILDFVPKSFIMVIYDRSGRKLFESADPYNEGWWDGTFKGGGNVMEGVYVYHIQYTEFTGATKTLTGNVTVIYP